jgi:hypothetical protein
MDEPAGVLLRWCRSAALAAVAMSAGVMGHLSAGGLMPGASALVLVFACCVGGAAVFLGRPASRLRVVGLLVGGQTFVHGTLTALAGHRGDPPLGYAHQPDGRHLQPALPYPVQHLVADMTGAHAGMALAHLAAAVLVGLWLAMGERALWTVLRLTADVGGRLLAPASATWLTALVVSQVVAGAARSLSRRRPISCDRAVAPTARALSRTVVRRGPPATLAT